jgi:hypothetical protein
VRWYRSGLRYRTLRAAQKPNWDDKFDGVVHHAKKIAGFVAEYSWLSNYFLCRVE